MMVSGPTKDVRRSRSRGCWEAARAIFLFFSLWAIAEGLEILSALRGSPIGAPLSRACSHDYVSAVCRPLSADHQHQDALLFSTSPTPDGSADDSHCHHKEHQQLLFSSFSSSLLHSRGGKASLGQRLRGDESSSPNTAALFRPFITFAAADFSCIDRATAPRVHSLSATDSTYTFTRCRFVADSNISGDPVVPPETDPYDAVYTRYANASKWLGMMPGNGRVPMLYINTSGTVRTTLRYAVIVNVSRSYVGPGGAIIVHGYRDPNVSTCPLSARAVTIEVSNTFFALGSFLGFFGSFPQTSILTFNGNTFGVEMGVTNYLVILLGIWLEASLAANNDLVKSPRLICRAMLNGRAIDEELRFCSPSTLYWQYNEIEVLHVYNRPLPKQLPVALGEAPRQELSTVRIGPNGYNLNQNLADDDDTPIDCSAFGGLSAFHVNLTAAYTNDTHPNPPPDSGVIGHEGRFVEWAYNNTLGLVSWFTDGASGISAVIVRAGRTVYVETAILNPQQDVARAPMMTEDWLLTGVPAGYPTHLSALTFCSRQATTPAPTLPPPTQATRVDVDYANRADGLLLDVNLTVFSDFAKLQWVYGSSSSAASSTVLATTTTTTSRLPSTIITSNTSNSMLSLLLRNATLKVAGHSPLIATGEEEEEVLPTGDPELVCFAVLSTTVPASISVPSDATTSTRLPTDLTANRPTDPPTDSTIRYTDPTSATSADPVPKGRRLGVAAATADAINAADGDRPVDPNGVGFLRVVMEWLTEDDDVGTNNNGRAADRHQHAQEAAPFTMRPGSLLARQRAYARHGISTESFVGSTPNSYFGGDAAAANANGGGEFPTTTVAPMMTMMASLNDNAGVPFNALREEMEVMVGNACGADGAVCPPIYNNAKKGEDDADKEQIIADAALVTEKLSVVPLGSSSFSSPSSAAGARSAFFGAADTSSPSAGIGGGAATAAKEDIVTATVPNGQVRWYLDIAPTSGGSGDDDVPAVLSIPLVPILDDDENEDGTSTASSNSNSNDTDTPNTVKDLCTAFINTTAVMQRPSHLLGVQTLLAEIACKTHRGFRILDDDDENTTDAADGQQDTTTTTSTTTPTATQQPTATNGFYIDIEVSAYVGYKPPPTPAGAAATSTTHKAGGAGEVTISIPTTTSSQQQQQLQPLLRLPTGTRKSSALMAKLIDFFSGGAINTTALTQPFVLPYKRRVLKEEGGGGGSNSSGFVKDTLGGGGPSSSSSSSSSTNTTTNSSSSSQVSMYSRDPDEDSTHWVQTVFDDSVHPIIRAMIGGDETFGAAIGGAMPSRPSSFSFTRMDRRGAGARLRAAFVGLGPLVLDTARQVVEARDGTSTTPSTTATSPQVRRSRFSTAADDVNGDTNSTIESAALIGNANVGFEGNNDPDLVVPIIVGPNVPPGEEGSVRHRVNNTLDALKDSSYTFAWIGIDPFLLAPFSLETQIAVAVGLSSCAAEIDGRFAFFTGYRGPAEEDYYYDVAATSVGVYGDHSYVATDRYMMFITRYLQQGPFVNMGARNVAVLHFFIGLLIVVCHAANTGLYSSRMKSAANRARRRADALAAASGGASNKNAVTAATAAKGGPNTTNTAPGTAINNSAWARRGGPSPRENATNATRGRGSSDVKATRGGIGVVISPNASLTHTNNSLEDREPSTDYSRHNSYATMRRGSLRPDEGEDDDDDTHTAGSTGNAKKNKPHIPSYRRRSSWQWFTFAWAVKWFPNLSAAIIVWLYCGSVVALADMVRELLLMGIDGTLTPSDVWSGNHHLYRQVLVTRAYNADGALIETYGVDDSANGGPMGGAFFVLGSPSYVMPMVFAVLSVAWPVAAIAAMMLDGRNRINRHHRFVPIRFYTVGNAGGGGANNGFHHNPNGNNNGGGRHSDQNTTGVGSDGRSQLIQHSQRRHAKRAERLKALHAKQREQKRRNQNFTFGHGCTSSGGEGGGAGSTTRARATRHQQQQDSTTIQMGASTSTSSLNNSSSSSSMAMSATTYYPNDDYECPHRGFLGAFFCADVVPAKYIYVSANTSLTSTGNVSQHGATPAATANRRGSMNLGDYANNNDDGNSGANNSADGTSSNGSNTSSLSGGGGGDGDFDSPNKRRNNNKRAAIDDSLSEAAAFRDDGGIPHNASYALKGYWAPRGSSDVSLLYVRGFLNAHKYPNIGRLMVLAMLLVFLGMVALVLATPAPTDVARAVHRTDGAGNGGAVGSRSASSSFAGMNLPCDIRFYVAGTIMVALGAAVGIAMPFVTTAMNSMTLLSCISVAVYIYMIAIGGTITTVAAENASSGAPAPRFLFSLYTIQVILWVIKVIALCLLFITTTFRLLHVLYVCVYKGCYVMRHEWLEAIRLSNLQRLRRERYGDGSNGGSRAYPSLGVMGADDGGYDFDIDSNEDSDDGDDADMGDFGADGSASPNGRTGLHHTTSSGGSGSMRPTYPSSDLSPRADIYDASRGGTSRSRTGFSDTHGGGYGYSGAGGGGGGGGYDSMGYPSSNNASRTGGQYQQQQQGGGGGGYTNSTSIVRSPIVVADITIKGRRPVINQQQQEQRGDDAEIRTPLTKGGGHDHSSSPAANDYHFNNNSNTNDSIGASVSTLRRSLSKAPPPPTRGGVGGPQPPSSPTDVPRQH